MSIFDKEYADIWYKPWTWNPISRPFGYAALVLIGLLIFCFIFGDY